MFQITIPAWTINVGDTVCLFGIILVVAGGYQLLHALRKDFAGFVDLIGVQGSSTLDWIMGLVEFFIGAFLLFSVWCVYHHPLFFANLILLNW